MLCLKRELAAYWSCSCIFCAERVSEGLLPLHLSQNLTSCSCHQSLVFQRLMARYSWWRGSLGVIFMAPNLTHNIFDPSSYTGTQCIGDKLISRTSWLHNLHCWAAVWACTIILVYSRKRGGGLWLFDICFMYSWKVYHSVQCFKISNILKCITVFSV